MKYQEQGIQCDFEEQEEKEKKGQTPNEESLPTGSRLTTLLVCACTAIFLQALVGPSAIVFGVHGRITKEVAGHDYYCRSHSSHHRTIALHRRRRLVWLRIFLEKLRLSALLRSHLHLLQPEMASLVAVSISELGSLICASSPNSTALIVGRAIAGLGSAGIILGQFYHHRMLCTARQTSQIWSILKQHVRHYFDMWTPTGRRSHRSPNMAVVFLH